jgi:hypothetical protein
MLIDRQNLDGPLPGENFLEDTRNHPWRRPPEYDDPDEFMRYVNKTFKRPHTMAGLETLISSGVTINTMTDMFISRSIMDGLISIDFGILLAGPTAKSIELFCVQLGIDYEMGFEDTEIIPTKEHIDRMARYAQEDGTLEMEEEEPEEVEAEPEADLGLMAPEADLLGDPAEGDVQAEMLGMNVEEEAEDELQ